MLVIGITRGVEDLNASGDEQHPAIESRESLPNADVVALLLRPTRKVSCLIARGHWG